jgi:hypothetical protein
MRSTPHQLGRSIHARKYAWIIADWVCGVSPFVPLVMSWSRFEDRPACGRGELVGANAFDFLDGVGKSQILCHISLSLTRAALIVTVFIRLIDALRTAEFYVIPPHRISN